MESQVEDERDNLRLNVFRLESEIAVAVGKLELGRQQLTSEQKRREQVIAEKDTELNSMREQFQNVRILEIFYLTNYVFSFKKSMNCSSVLKSKLNQHANSLNPN
jgi:hypothetical protein